MGRPRKSRIRCNQERRIVGNRAGLSSGKAKPKSCSLCFGKGHNARSCPVLDHHRAYLVSNIQVFCEKLGDPTKMLVSKADKVVRNKIRDFGNSHNLAVTKKLFKEGGHILLRNVYESKDSIHSIDKSLVQVASIKKGGSILHNGIYIYVRDLKEWLKRKPKRVHVLCQVRNASSLEVAQVTNEMSQDMDYLSDQESDG